MKSVFVLAILLIILLLRVASASSDHPLTCKADIQYQETERPFGERICREIILYQYKLKKKMSELIRMARTGESLDPLLLLMGIAFLYGVIHAVGPGHGKVVAVSYVLSHRLSIKGGTLFGLCIALIHGFSGAIGVLGLRYIIQRSVNETLASVTIVTQVVSFGLIALLGAVILVKNGRTLFFTSQQKGIMLPEGTPRSGMLPWASTVGLVPCPAVVMVMLFCLSMNALSLGLLLAACISLGMAATISFLVTCVLVGKTGALKVAPKNRVKTIEVVVGIFSGAAIMTFGTLFLLTALHQNTIQTLS
jgi:nickel/cobalt exporter